MTFSQDELFEALLGAIGERDGDETPNSFTVREFRRAKGMGYETATRLLDDAVEKGLVRREMVAKRNRHGILQRVPGYVLVERSEAN